MASANRIARQDALMSLHRLATPLNEATISARKLGEQFNETFALLEAYDGDTDSLIAGIRGNAERTRRNLRGTWRST